MDIFPSPYIHIGGDECPKERWKECERCQAKIAELGLKDIDGHSKEEQLQTWFMDEVAKQIRARGRKMIGWNEIRIWTEWVKDAKKMEWELLPRLAAPARCNGRRKNSAISTRSCSVCSTSTTSTDS